MIQEVCWLSVSPKVIETGAKLERGAQEEFGLHFVEILLFQRAFDPGQTGGEFLEFLLERRHVSLLKPFYVKRFDDVNGASG